MTRWCPTCGEADGKTQLEDLELAQEISRSNERARIVALIRGRADVHHKRSAVYRQDRIRAVVLRNLADDIEAGKAE